MCFFLGGGCWLFRFWAARLCFVISKSTVFDFLNKWFLTIPKCVCCCFVFFVSMCQVLLEWFLLFEGCPALHAGCRYHVVCLPFKVGKNCVFAQRGKEVAAAGSNTR